MDGTRTTTRSRLRSRTENSHDDNCDHRTRVDNTWCNGLRVMFVPSQSVFFQQGPCNRRAPCQRGSDRDQQRRCDVHGGNAELAVSVLIPARNEAPRIGPLIDSVLGSAGIHCEVCVLDDESHDGTDAIVLNYSRDHANVRLIRGTPVPAGWSGKQFACWQLAHHASFPELVFLDADVTLAPDAPCCERYD